jgi:hypothetical protein
MSQKKLNGRPRTMGYTRSHRATEKQVATKGMNPRRTAPSDGGFTPNLPQLIRGIVAGFRYRSTKIRQEIFLVHKDAG